MHMLTSPGGWLHLDWVLAVVSAWLLIGCVGVVALRRLRFVATVLFPLGACVSVALMAIALSASFAEPETAVLPLGLPHLPFHLRLDGLSHSSCCSLAASQPVFPPLLPVTSVKGEGTPPGLICLEYHVFLASIAMVVLADDAYVFMVVWETMAFSSFFLVMANHRIPDIRRAGYLYMLVAHIGALGILLCFGLLQANTGDYTFANMRAQHLTPFWGSVAFGLAVFGFGAKAGLLPLHVWLPEAHPAAPSPFSALMSGVMLKIALYGILRVSFDLLQTRIWWWGVLLMVIGLATALFGVVFSTVQVEMKRLLAYSSIENIGLMCAGMGLSLLFSAYAMHALSALALTAALYHMISHAFFQKPAVLQHGRGVARHRGAQPGQAGWLDPHDALGGLAHPDRCAVLRRAAAVWWLHCRVAAAAKLFVHHRFAHFLPGHAGSGAGGADCADCGAVRLHHGQIFRGDLPGAAARRKAGAGARRGSLGAPGHAVAGDRLRGCWAVSQPDDCADRPGDAHAGACRTGAHRGRQRLAAGAECTWSVPAMRLPSSCWVCWPASGWSFFLVRRLYHGRLRRVPPWDCGHPWQTARMQDTAEGFGQPIRQIFEPFFRMTRHLPTRI
jgi:hydrogenase-4 component B